MTNGDKIRQMSDEKLGDRWISVDDALQTDRKILPELRRGYAEGGNQT